MASTGRDRAIAASFAKQLASGENPTSVTSGDISAAGESNAETPDRTAAMRSATLEGQITELICGRPPEVIFTVNGGSSQLLLHVKDITKLEMRVTGTAANSSLPCTEWKDRKVKVEFSQTAEGTAQGEVESIEFE